MDSCPGIFLDYSARKLRQAAGRIADCLSRLTDEQIWTRGADSENAVGNLVRHLSGNVRQWIVSGVGGETDVRQRDTEFAARGGMTAPELAAHLRTAVDEAAAVIENLPLTELTRRIAVQGYDVTVLEAIYHVVEHFSGHTGQIIFATKWLTGKDLNFYPHLKTAGHSERTP
ncbi:MAG TPA: DinB family protein [Bryobacteraceae bacterium]|nr:DinB family protein [Bryobacteraceae bacterium]